MLTIRFDQFDTFSDNALNEFAEHLNELISDEGLLPETPRDTNQQLAEILRLIDEAEEYEITIDDDVSAYVITQLLHGSKLTPPLPEFLQICSDRTLVMQDKIDNIINQFCLK